LPVASRIPRHRALLGDELDLTGPDHRTFSPPARFDSSPSTRRAVATATKMAARPKKESR
jgi:hypothetical protein